MVSPNTSGEAAGLSTPGTVNDLLNGSSNGALANSGPAYEEARRKVLATMATSDNLQSSFNQAQPHPGNASQSTPTRGRGRGRGGRGRGRGGGRGGKRKRDEDEIKAHDSTDDDQDEDEDPDSIAATTTKSGRSVQKPSSFQPQTQSPTTVKRRKHHHRRNPENTVCLVCYRPHSPASNMIVFCDGCNAAYHRYCHHPPIDQEVVDIPDKEWLCSDCHKYTAASYIELDVTKYVSKQGLTDEQKRNLLSHVPPPTLVSLLVHVSNISPELPLFPPSRSSTSPQPVTAQVPTITTNGGNHIAVQNQAAPRPGSPQRPPDDEDDSDNPDGYPSDYEPDPPATYPKPGYGLARTLPPEQQDLDILVDDNAEVYTHIYQTKPKEANAAVYGAQVEDVVDRSDPNARNGADASRKGGEESAAEMQVSTEDKLPTGDGAVLDGAGQTTQGGTENVSQTAVDEQEPDGKTQPQEHGQLQDTDDALLQKQIAAEAGS